VNVLELENVNKHYREAGRERVVLRDVMLEVHAEELVAVWGTRRSGRTTLLRIAAGIETPDGGEVRFRGRRVDGHGGAALGQGIGYVQKTLRGSEEQAVIEQVAAVALARGAGFAQAREQARVALQRVEAGDCAAMRIGELTSGESLRVALARALCPSPALLVVDEPTATARLGERDEILALLGRLAADGVAVLASVSEPDELAGAHRALTLSDGELRGRSSPSLAPVVALRRGKM
jgi:ABC-type multidrug transport system ATPase subunit